MQELYPMRERDRIELRKHREEVEALERAEQEERERPTREAIAKFKKTADALAAIERENLLKIKDDQFYVDPETIGLRMTDEQANSFNKTEAEKFKQNNPDYYPCAENFQKLVEYIERNGGSSLYLISASTLEAAFKRLKSAGILFERPAPEPEAEPLYVNLKIGEPEHVPQLETEDGFDPITGEEITLTHRQVARLTADEYRRFKRLYRFDLTVPNIGPGPSGRRYDNV